MVAAAIVLATLGTAALAPLTPRSREEVFEIPDGTWSRRMAGNDVEILPSEIRLTLEVRDILVLKNLDSVPQLFGPTLMMPGQTFRLPFDVASEYQFDCSAHQSGQMTVLVDEAPTPGWPRLRWRTKNLLRALFNL